MTDNVLTFRSRAQLAQEAFDAYVTAFLKMQQTLDFNDGREAARLWHKFIDLYDETDLAAAERRMLPPFSPSGADPA